MAWTSGREFVFLEVTCARRRRGRMLFGPECSSVARDLIPVKDSLLAAHFRRRPRAQWCRPGVRGRGKDCHPLNRVVGKDGHPIAFHEAKHPRARWQPPRALFPLSEGHGSISSRGQARRSRAVWQSAPGNIRLDRARSSTVLRPKARFDRPWLVGCRRLSFLPRAANAVPEGHVGVGISMALEAPPHPARPPFEAGVNWPLGGQFTWAGDQSRIGSSSCRCHGFCGCCAVGAR